MSRNNFFSDTPKPSIKDIDPSESLQAHSSLANQKSKRMTYSIKIDPDVRKEIKDWAIKNNVTISSVIETLAKLYLHRLDPRDIQ